MTPELSIGDTHIFNSTIFVANEEDLINSSCLWELMDESGVLYAQGVCEPPVVNALPSGQTSMSLKARVMVPVNLPIETITTYFIKFNVTAKTSSTKYTNTVTFTVADMDTAAVDDTLVEMQGVPIVVSVNFPHLAHTVPVLSSSDITINEGEVADFVFNLSVASTSDVTFVYATRALTTTSGDFVPQSGHVTIPAGSTSFTVSVPTVDNSLGELDRAFVLDIFNVEGASHSTTSFKCTIQDNDLPIITVADIVVNEDASTATFTFTASFAVLSPVVINYATQDSTAIAGTDYVAATGSVVIPTGQTTAQVHVVITNDEISQGDLLFKLLVNSVSDNATRGTAEASATVKEDDYFYSFTANEYYAKMGSPLSVVVNTGDTGSDHTIDIAVTDVTAFVDVDYPSSALPLQVSQSSADVSDQFTISIPTLTRAVPANARYFEVKLENPTGNTATGHALKPGSIVTAKCIIFD
ncbi:hypothetical protein GR7B_00092 [Vibrio phage vB_VcorM_GR7B]|nr:hypothetical protein GR7B_00092 [Vibrio phage vB_VcorM_GR7B]